MCKGFIDFLRQYGAETQRGKLIGAGIKGGNKDSVNAEDTDANKYRPAVALRKR